MATRIDSVTRSAYMITSPPMFRAARPTIWISDQAERRNPSLSASRIATRVTSGRSIPSRSEEHTSELQSQFHLVCRLLLEKKKKKIIKSLTFNKKKKHFQ